MRIKRIISDFLRGVDCHLGTIYIPVSQFGWKVLHKYKDGFGVEIEDVIWLWPESERKPYYEFNRRIERYRCMARRWAWVLDRHTRGKGKQ